MIIPSEDVQMAKDKLGDQNAIIMAKELGIENFDERNLKCCCPYHEEKTPSFIFNKKNKTMHCFACSKTVDILDVFMQKGETYLGACKKLFELADMPYSFGEANTKTKRNYRYPVEEEKSPMFNVTSYMETRGISSKTLEYVDVREDKRGNCAFNYYDTNDVLTLVKYRPSKKVVKGETKTWCQKDADTSPLLFNMNRINANQPLLITEGEIDCMSAIEAGYQNTVSVPFGAGNFTWIETNWNWLEQFDSIIIASDNDDPGNKMRQECVYRLGSWRCKVVEIPYQTEDGQNQISDLNDMLLHLGKEKLLTAIINAKDTPVDSVVDFSDIGEVDLSEIDGIYTGIEKFDKELMRLFFGTFNIVTGVNGCVDGETEYFNGKEWKKISEYKRGEKVLEYTRSGKPKLVRPLIYHKYPCNHFWHLTANDVDQCVSDEHNLVYYNKEGTLTKRNILLYMIDKEEGDFISSLGRSGEVTYRKEDRKAVRQILKIIAGLSPVEYSFTANQYKQAVKKLLPILARDIFYEENNKELIDFIQYAFSTAGYFTVSGKVKHTQSAYYVRFAETERTTDIRITKVTAPENDQYKYCFTVPSGKLILRRNGIINVTGNSGKSSWLLQLIAQALDQGKDAWLYSKELPNYMTKNWANFIFAGNRHVKQYITDKNAVYYKVDNETKAAIDEHYQKRFHIYKDGVANRIEDIQKSMVDSARKFGAKLFIIDNLTAINLDCAETDKWGKQVEFVNWLIDFAQKYHVVVILVIHPKKIETMRRLSKFDVAGLGSIVDLAHRLISLYRVTPKDKKGVKNMRGGWQTEPIPYDVMVDVLKDRMTGKENLEIGLYYDVPSRRFFTNRKEYEWQYAWDKAEYKTPLPLPLQLRKEKPEPRIFGEME